jgi:hypothetical protein
MNGRVGTTQMSLPEPLGSGEDPGNEPDEDKQVISGPFDDKAAEDVQAATLFQINYNTTFIRSFISSVRFGPLSGQLAVWQRIGSKLDAQRSKKNDSEAQRNGFAGNKVLVLLGSKDAIIPRNEVEPDIKEALGKRNVKLAIFDAGHDLPVKMAEKTTEKIWETWKEFGVVS